MVNIYNNIIADNQEVSRVWLYIANFIIIINLISSPYLDLSIHLFFIVIGMFVVSSATTSKFNFVSKIASLTSAFGTILIVSSALMYKEDIIINKFFSIYNNLFYIVGLALFLAGVLIQSLVLIIDKFNFCLKNFAHITIAIIIIFAVLSVFITFYLLKSTLIGNIAFDHQEFYQIIFCSFNNILNFFFIQLFIMCVIYIFEEYLLKKKVFNQSEINIFALLNLLAVISSFSSFFLYKVNSSYFINFYYFHQKIFSGIVLGMFLFRIIFIAVFNYKEYDSKIKKTLLLGILCFVFVLAHQLSSDFVLIKKLLYYASVKPLPIIYLAFISSKIIFIILCIRFLRKNNDKKIKTN